MIMTASKRTLIWLAIMIVVVALLSGCKSIQYVPVETVKTDTLYQKVVQHDSIHVHDSVTIHQKGDTVIFEKYHTKYIDRLLRDTVYRSRVDSIAVPYPVERKLSKWEQVCIDYGKIMLGATLILLVVAVWWLVRKIRKFS